MVKAVAGVWPGNVHGNCAMSTGEKEISKQKK
jgi:hypothetical protein